MYFKEFSKKCIIVVMGGRFSPFTQAHHNNYKLLQKKFGKENVFICTSDKVSLPDSPFNFEEKREIIRKLFFIPEDRIIKTKQPYQPRELLKDFPEDTIVVFGVGEKDRDRLASSNYFEEYSKNSNKGYKDKAYYIILPNFHIAYKGKSVVMSASLFRKAFRKAKTNEQQEQVFKDFYENFNKKIFRLFVDTLIDKSYTLSEGGGFGHLSHPFEVETFTFKDLKELIESLLKGNVKVSEKIDGLNLMFTVIDGEIRFARNHSHIKNFGTESLTLESLDEKFKDRGNIKDSFISAGEDLETLIDSFSDEEKEDIFKNGKVFLNAEIVNKNTLNTIPYDDNFIRVNGGLEYDEDGNVVDNSLENLDGLYSKLHKIKTETYDLQPIKNIYLNKVKSPSKEFLETLDELEYSSGLSSTGLIKDSSPEIKKELDSLFLRLGTVLIQNTFRNDTNKVRSIVENLKDQANKILKSGNKKDIKILKEESDRLDIAGGFPSINSNEGFVVDFKGNLIKITGSFSPVNKIINLLKYK